MRFRPKCLIENESGITALETAIILIAFVVVAAIFSFTILTTGTFLTERSKEAAYAGLQEVNTSMVLKGSVVLEETGMYILFHLASVTGGGSVDLSKVNMTYRDNSTTQDVTLGDPTCTDLTSPGADFSWNATTADGTALPSCILSQGTIARIWVNLGPRNSITSYQNFSLQIIPPSGATLLINRTAPPQVVEVTDLH